MQESELYGLVLAGGKSTRMGKDKGLLIYHRKPQREYLFDLLEKYCKHVFISCRADQLIPEYLNPLVDQFDFNSPINGILSAFEKFPDKAWLIVAVDMPYVDDNILTMLIKYRDTNKVATCFYNPNEKLPEPLLTLWEPISYSLLLQFVKDGKKSPRDFLKNQPIHLIDPPDNKTLLNFNSPGDLPL